jgi:hypothetical protein
MKQPTRIAVFLLSLYCLVSCKNKQNNCDVVFQKLIKTSIYNDYNNISADSIKSLNLCHERNRIDSTFKEDGTYFGYFILHRFEGNCSSDHLKSWHFKAKYTDSIYSANKCKVYEGDCIFPVNIEPANSFTITNDFSSTDNLVCARQIIMEDIVEIYYFFRMKKTVPEYNRTSTFGFNK